MNSAGKTVSDWGRKAIQCLVCFLQIGTMFSRLICKTNCNPQTFSVSTPSGGVPSFPKLPFIFVKRFLTLIFNGSSCGVERGLRGGMVERTLWGRESKTCEAHRCYERYYETILK